MTHNWVFFSLQPSITFWWQNKMGSIGAFKLHLPGRESYCHPGLQSASVSYWWGCRGWATEGLAGQFPPHWTAALQSCKAPPEPRVTTVLKQAAGTAQALCEDAKREQQTETSQNRPEGNVLRNSESAGMVLRWALGEVEWLTKLRAKRQKRTLMEEVKKRCVI